MNQKTLLALMASGSFLFFSFSILFYILAIKAAFPKNFIQAPHIENSLDLSEHNLTFQNLTCVNFLGASMQPTIFQGNTGCYIPFDASKIQQGHIIAYTTKEGDFIVHRVKSVLSNKEVLVQGDNNKAIEKISVSQINGTFFLIILT